MTWNDTQGETLSHKCDVRHCASTDGARRAQNCALYTSVCFVVSVPLFAMWFRLFMSVCRSQMFVNMRCRIHSLYKIDHVYVGGFCLTPDQLFCFPEKLPRSVPKMILYKSQIRVIVFSELNCYSKSGLHKRSPNGQIHIQIFHKIARLFSIDFPDHGEDGFHVVRCVQRYLKVVVPCRFSILLTLHVNWRTDSACKGVAAKLYCFGQQVLLCCTKSQPPDCQSLLNLLLLLDASFSRTWDVDAASNELDSILILLSGLPEAIGINRTRCCGWNCRNIIRRHTHHCWSRLGHNPFFFFLFLNYFAIVEQPIKLKFLVQRRQLKWQIFWTNEEDCSTRHVWNFPLSTCLRVGVWCQCNGFEFVGPN